MHVYSYILQIASFIRLWCIHFYYKLHYLLDFCILVYYRFHFTLDFPVLLYMLLNEWWHDILLATLDYNIQNSLDLSFLHYI